jgi:hypothetical protein
LPNESKTKRKNETKRKKIGPNETKDATNEKRKNFFRLQSKTKRNESFLRLVFVSFGPHNYAMFWMFSDPNAPEE